MAHKCRCLTLVSVTCSAYGYCHSLPGWDSSLSQVTPCFFVKLPLQSASTIFTPWRGEVLGESGVLPEKMIQ